MTIRNRSLVLALLFASFPLCPIARADDGDVPAKENFHLFLLVGQSNMAGRGLVEEQDMQAHSRVLMLTKENRWVPAVDPMHFDKSSAGVGLGRTFGIEIAAANPAITVGLIPAAHGGSPISAWQPGIYYEPTKGHPWDDAIKRTNEALKVGVLKGILWHQGESDSKAETAVVYEAKLHDLIARFRQEFASPKLSFTVGQLGQFAERPWDASRKLVDAAHQNLPKQVAHTAFVSSNGLTHKGDEVHFDSKSYRELGLRYAQAFQDLSQ